MPWTARGSRTIQVICQRLLQPTGAFPAAVAELSRSLQKMNWPDLASFEATVGRLATAEDTRANRASFLLEVDGVRIGTPIDMLLPCFALYRDDDANEPKRAVIFQAEEADGIRYFGGWLIDDEIQIVGFEGDFDLLTREQIHNEQGADGNTH